MKVLVLVTVALLLGGCNNKKMKTKEGSSDTSLVNSKKNTTGFDHEPVLNSLDSLQVLFYDDPDGDSLRYTRFFKMVSTADSLFIKSLKAALNEVAVIEAGTRQCRSDGKMYLYGKKEVVKTLYFSTRSDSCNYIYFIKDGNFIYLPMTTSLASAVKSYKVKSVKPTVN